MFTRPDIEFIPQEVSNQDILGGGANIASPLDPLQETSENVVQRLLDHLAIINEYKDRLDTIDYLAKNAEALAGNPKYSTDKQDILGAIKAFGGSGDTVDFNMFKQSIDIILQNYNNMSIVALSGTQS